MTQPCVAILGLGSMGAGMAGNLLRAGFPLTVYNRRPEKGAALVSAGATLAATPRDAARGATVILSMVADDRASRAVWTGEQGALSGADRGALLIESSTLTVGWVKELAQAAQAADTEFIDAPVTGSRDQAAAAQLLFLVGGPDGALERARPVLSVMSRGIVHAGPIGSGALLKLINNFMSGAQAAVLAETMAFVERSGLDRAKVLDVLLNGAPGSPLVKTLTPRMTERAYTPPNFSLRLMTKDLTYARDEAARVGLTLETATCALALYERSVAAGRGDLDFSAVVEDKRQQSSS